MEPQLHNLIVLQFPIFKDVEIGNFFCDPSQLLNLTCSDSFTNYIVMYFVGAIFGVLPISGILFSYYKIISSILRNPSAGGKYKVFSTCGSQLFVYFMDQLLESTLVQLYHLPPGRQQWPQ
jgi:olfactory receptor